MPASIEIARVVAVIWVLAGFGRFLLHSLEGRRLGRLVKARHPEVWEAERPMPWVLIMDQRFMGFVMQRKYAVIEDEALVQAFEELRTGMVRTMVFVGTGFAIAGAFAVFLG